MSTPVFEDEPYLVLAGAICSTFFFIGISLWIIIEGSGLSVATQQQERKRVLTPTGSIISNITDDSTQDSPAQRGSRVIKFTRKDAIIVPITSFIILIIFFLIYVYISKNIFNVLAKIFFFIAILFIFEYFIRKILAKKWLHPEPSAISCSVALIAAIWYLADNPWILNNLLATAVSIYILQFVHLNRFITAIVLLLVLFIYDIFMVFYSGDLMNAAVEKIIPSIVARPEMNSTSYATSLVTSSHHNAIDAFVDGIEVPNKFLFPIDLFIYGWNACDFTVVGAGDVIIPGLLLALLKRFEMSLNRGNWYFCVTLTIYVISMLLCFVSAAVADRSQPALLYLVPPCILTPILMAMCRCDVMNLFRYRDYPSKSERQRMVEEHSVMVTEV